LETGPSGATTAYYLCTLAQVQGQSIKVALLDKATFPRDKFCGDAWCAPALDILEDMGVLQRLQARGVVNETLSGGFVSPNGYSFIANDRGKTDTTELDQTARAFAIKRIICDEAIARRAVEVGASLFEGALVTTCTLNETTKLWTVRCEDGRLFTSKLIVCADGAASNVARKLGLVLTAPEGVAARQYVKAGTHNFKADGVLLYPEYTLPGYMALFRHFDDTIDLGAYLLPGGAAKESDIPRIYSELIATDPFISRALGPKWEPLERVKVASLRLGGVDQSYGDQVLIVGDAAGHIDPLTGEGIHLGMMAGKLAARTALQMLRQGDLSAARARAYHDAWWKLFGSDFPVSAVAGKMVFKAPYLMDAVPIAAAAKGDGKAASAFFAAFGAVMTGALPKSTFLLPWVAAPLAWATAGVFFNRCRGTGRGYYDEPSDEERLRKTSWEAQCLLDTSVPCGEAASKSRQLDALLAGMFRWGQPSSARPPVLVMYGTETGYSKEVAGALCDALADRFAPRLVNLVHHALVEWDKESTLLAVCSTSGDGDSPVDAREFIEHVPPGVANVRFAVLAPGDKAYPNFCSAGHALASALAAKGARALLPVRELDGENPPAVDAWVRDVLAALPREPWAAAAGGNNNGAEGEDYLRANARQSGATLLREKGATRDAPFTATLKTRTWVAPDKVHIVLDVAGAGALLAYVPGDALGVLPDNDPAEVARLVALVPGLSAADVERKNLKDASAALLALLGLAAASAAPEARATWVSDLVKSAPGVSAKALLDCMTPLRPRLYSIASSPLATPDEVHLIVAVVKYKGADGRTTGGVCSTWLADRVKLGDAIPVFVQANADFRMPESSATPKLMIGPGTGVAPFLSFLRHDDALQVTDAESTLFFGCRSAKEDFMFEHELTRLLGKPACKLVTAFSRDQKEKVYVQHRLRQESKHVWSALQRGGRVYICGDGQHMASDVKEALVDICASVGKLSRADAEALVKTRTQVDVWVT